MQTQVYKIHSDFFYVRDKNHNEYVCKLRDVLKKQKTQILVGDFVKLSDDYNFIVSLQKRKNFIPRPKAANIDLAVVVCALYEPELDLIQLNRYLTFLKFHNIESVICFNKEDLDKNIKQTKKIIEKIYKPLGYKTFFISAKNKTDLKEFSKYIQNKTVVFCGGSGVGKSTILNSLNPMINIKTQNISHKTKRGCHTTRHCEIIEFNNYKIMDTPGFSCLKFDFLLPDKLINLFDDIKKYSKDCKYSNCLHNEDNKDICSVIYNLDKIDKSRYESYLCFLNESLEYKNKISKQSIKEEELKKETGSKTRTKISKKKREESRKTTNQKLNKTNIKGA